jgi:hypothetical protein
MPFQMTAEDIKAVRPTKLTLGMKELFYEFTGSFLKHLNDPSIQTIMIDTGTLLYDITCQGYLQELQEKQLPLNAQGRDTWGKPLRTQLLPIEYREPYIRMRGFAYQAKARGKHLVVTHHASDEYGMVRIKGELTEGKTGKRVMHGWSQWGDSADVIGHIRWDKAKSKPYFDVELAEVKELEGMSIEEPSFTKIDGIIKAIRGES